MKGKLIMITLSMLVFVAILLFQLAAFSDGKLHVVFCDVGQGDGIYIRTPKGVDIIVDAGPGDKILSCLNRHMPFWDRTIELAFATHPDADHITGFTAILKSYTVQSFNTSERSSTTGVYQAIQDLLREKGVPKKYLYAGDTYTTTDGVKIINYWPTHVFVKTDTSDSTNRYSLVQSLKFKNFDLLLDGDIEFDILNKIFAKGVTVDVFKLPHHGSKTGINEETFTLIHPKLGILSVGKKNRYGHPSPIVISLLNQFHIPFQSTAEVGDIEIVTDGATTKMISHE